MTHQTKIAGPLALTLVACALFFASSALAAGEKEKYEAKVKENNDTIGVIASVINYVCPKIAPADSKICDGDDPVKKAVALATHIDEGKPVQHKAAGDQFVDAVDHFKQHYPLRDKARDFAKKGDFANAYGYEEYAFQYLVKVATQGLLAKNMVDAK